jgi:hypothetical protein
LIVVVLECEPVVLRRVKEGGSWERWVYLGDAFVHGFMHGEAAVGLEGRRYKVRIFEIH